MDAGKHSLMIPVPAYLVPTMDQNGILGIKMAYLVPKMDQNGSISDLRLQPTSIYLA